jgi:hypothetical protein
VFHTDLEWPGLLAIVDPERIRTSSFTYCMHVRNLIFREGIPPNELVRRMANFYRQSGCDGLCLSAVTYEGVRLPIDPLVDLLSITRPPRFVVIDGAQSIGHAPGLPRCDMLLGGCHKWLRGGHPMGLAFSPKKSSQEYLRLIVDEMTASGDLDDPLLIFSRELERGTVRPFFETLSVAALFSSASAVAASVRDPVSSDERYETRIASADDVTAMAEGTGWEPVRGDPLLGSGILLLKTNEPATASLPAGSIREAFQEQRVTLSAYVGGTTRLSMPGDRWESGDLRQLRAALRSCL